MSCLSTGSPLSFRGCLEASFACISRTIISCSNGTSPSQFILQAVQEICFTQQARPLDIAWQLLAFNWQNGDLVCLICLPVVHVPAEDEQWEQDGHLRRSISELSLPQVTMQLLTHPVKSQNGSALASPSPRDDHTERRNHAHYLLIIASTFRHVAGVHFISME